METWISRRLGNILRSGDELRTNCPFCYARTGRPDNKHHLYVSLVKPVAYCHRCNWSGHYIGLVMSVEGCSYVKALQIIDNPPVDVGGFAALYSPRGLVQGQTHAAQPSGFLPIYNKLAWDDREEQKAVLMYLRRRKVPHNLINTKFGWVPGTHRVWILIDKNWWQGRLIIPGKPKYISPPWPISDSLWNVEALRLHNKVVVCEGVFSAIAVGENAIALCSKHATNLQVQRIAYTRAKEVVLMLDADAHSDASELADRLVYIGYKGAIRIQYMEQGDPADGEYGDEVTWVWDEKVRIGLFA